jgi:hypothetical protein
VQADSATIHRRRWQKHFIFWKPKEIHLFSSSALISVLAVGVIRVNFKGIWFQTKLTNPNMSVGTNILQPNPIHFGRNRISLLSWLGNQGHCILFKCVNKKVRILFYMNTPCRNCWLYIQPRKGSFKVKAKPFFFENYITSRLTPFSILKKVRWDNLKSQDH